MKPRRLHPSKRVRQILAVVYVLGAESLHVHNTLYSSLKFSLPAH